MINKLDQFNISNVFYTKNLAYSQDVHDSEDIVHKTPELTTSIQSPSIIAEIGINHNGSKEHFIVVRRSGFLWLIYRKFQYFKAKNRVGNVRELEHVEKAQDMEENIEKCLADVNCPYRIFVRQKKLLNLMDRAMCTLSLQN